MCVHLCSAINQLIQTVISLFAKKTPKISLLIDINSLPTEVMVKIFELLDITSQMRAKQVSHRWYELIGLVFVIKTKVVVGEVDYNDINRYVVNHDDRLLSYVCISHSLKRKYTQEVKICTEDLQTLLAQLVTMFPKLNTLYICIDLFGDLFSGLNVIQAVVQSCDKDLQQLSIIATRRRLTITKTDVLEMVKKFPNLCVLQMKAYTITIDENTIQLILKCLPKLKVFVLKSGLFDHKIKIPYNEITFKDTNPGIKIIKISDNIFNVNTVQILADKQLQHLRQLSIYELRDLEIISLFGNYFQSIRRLSCTTELGLEGVDVFQMFVDISRLEQLEELKVKLYETYEEIGWFEIQCLRSCRKLRSLQLKGMDGITPDCVRAMTRFVPQLQELDISDIDVSQNLEDFLEDILHFKSLTHLTFSQTDYQTLIKLLSNSLRIQYINIEFCYVITIESIVGIIQMVNKTPDKYLKLSFDACFEADFEELGLKVPHNLCLEFE